MPLNNTLNSGSGFAWFDLLVCPDCAHSLVRSDVIECSHCGRQFRQIDRALCLLPSGNADAVAFDVPAPKWKARIIARFYSRAKESRNALQGLRRVLSDLRSHCWGLNAGSSSTRIHSQMINLDLCASPDVDI